MGYLAKFVVVSILSSLGAFAAPVTAGSSSLGNFELYDLNFGYNSGGCFAANGQFLDGSENANAGCSNLFTVTNVSNGVTVSTSEGNCGIAAGAFSCAADIASTVFTLNSESVNTGPCLQYEGGNWFVITASDSVFITGSGDSFCLGYSTEF